MPSSDLQSKVALLVGIDKSSYTKARSRIENLFEERHNLKIDERALDGLADTVRDAVEGAGKEVSKGLIGRFNSDMDNLLNQWTDVQADLIKATDADNKEMMELLLDRQRLIDAEIKAAADSHKKRAAAAKELEKMLQPSAPKFQEAAEGFADTFTDTLNNLKGGDLAGLAKAFSGVVGKKLQKGAELKQAQSAAAATKESAAALGATAGQLAAVAAGLAAVTAVAVAVIGVMVMADSQAKEMNETILEGAGMADVALAGVNGKLGDMTEGLEEARKAAFDMAFEFRSTPKEMTGIISSLNQAGFTLKEMREQAGGVAEAIRTTFVASKALGISVSDTADIMNQWTADFGMGLEEINERFASIEQMSMKSGMGTKRFFTAVSQATSGMALYNNRMEEAAGLLLQTSKVLGDTDASDFIKSLTKGFADESYTDRFKRIMISGIGDVKKIMEKDSLGMARNFSKTFKDNVNVQTAFGEIGVDMNVLGKPEELKATLGKLTKEDTQKLVTTLRMNNQDAAAREIENTARLIQSSKGGVTEMAKGLDLLSMGGKLAVKMQGLGNKRISQMSGIELAAFEQYAGIGGEQLEQLRKVDANLVGEWNAITGVSEEVKKTGEVTGQQADMLKKYNLTVDKQGKIHDANGDILSDIDDYTMKSQGRLEEAAKTQTQASFYAHQTMENTRSITDQLSTGLQYMLERIYEVLTAFYSWVQGKTPEQIKAQQDAMDVNTREQGSIRTALEEIGGKIAEQREILSTGSEEARDAAKEQLKLLEESKKRKEGELTVARGTGEMITELEAGDFKTLEGAIGKAEAAFLATPEGLDALGAQVGSLEGAISVYNDAATKAEAERQSSMGLRSGSLMEQVAAKFGLAEGEAGRTERGTKEFGSALKEGLTAEQARAEAEAQADRDAGIKAMIATSGGDTEKAIADLTKKYPDMSQKALKTALDRHAAEQEVITAGFGDTEEAADLAEALVMGGREAARARSKLAGGAPPPTPVAPGTSGDFIMRPGQSAQRFSSADTVVGMKEGGPLASMGGGGGGNVHVTINGGDQSKVYATVKSALKNSGLRP